ncbi:7TM diverse intracellular signaling domain-containing protein [Limibacter armeniacum]|uniref:7TM diverse intracellular signaling domain-containing protein n=1 Tax=Limibacter armeniacum TaxID=466084 RepID=UPI002FE53848
MLRSRIFATALLLLIAHFSVGQFITAFPVELQQSDSTTIASGQVFVDSSSAMTLDEVLAVDWSEKGKELIQDIKPIEGALTAWVKIALHNNTSQTQWTLHMLKGGLSSPCEMEVYYAPESGTGRFYHARSGYYLKASHRSIIDQHNRVLLDLYPGESYIMYVRLRNTHYDPLELPMAFQDYTYWSTKKQEENSDRSLWEGIFLGMICVMAIYNALIALLSRDRVYVYYAIYLMLAAVYFMYRSRFIHTYLIPEVPYLAKYIWPSSILASAMYLLFMSEFLEFKRKLPKWNKVVVGVVLLCGIAFLAEMGIAYFTGNEYLNNIINTNLFLASVVFGFVTLGVLWKIRNVLMIYFVIGSLQVWIGAFIGVLTEQYYLVQVGLVLEIIAFSLGLGHRIRQNEREKQKAQTSLIEQLKKNQDLQQKVNEELESRVRVRTKEIENQKEELQRQHDHLSEANDKIMRQAGMIAEKNKKILDSINYAQRIQDAMLPDVKVIRNIFPEAFVFFKPKDIVSGDFYWCHHENGKSFIAATDCTGHGVPGAFMSVVGFSLLEQLVKSEKIHHPSQILNRMHSRIRELLNQKETQNKDGMDMSLCMIDYEAGKLYFSGAKNPLYLFQEGHFKEIKGDRISLGGSGILESDSGFVVHEIDLNVPTTFYIFSDGYVDQFGGADKRKFLSRNFKELLQQVYFFPLEEQADLLKKKMEEWMKEGGETQVDDMLVIGIKVGPVKLVKSPDKAIGITNN